MNTGNGDFEKDLNEIENQYRSAPQDEPPAMLDQAILNKAAQAVEKRPIRPWNFGWMHATATTALVLLGLTLTLQLKPESPRPSLEYEQNVPVTGNAEQYRADSDSEVSQKRIESKEDVFVPLGKQEADTASEPAPRTVADDMATPTEAMKTSVDELRRENTGPEQRQRSLRAAQSVAAPMDQASYEVKDLLMEESVENPDEWIARILKLKHQHEVNDWMAELNRFLATYPDYPLPDELIVDPKGK